MGCPVSLELITQSFGTLCSDDLEASVDMIVDGAK